MSKNERFDYSKTLWGLAKIDSYITNFQGFELELLVKKFRHKKNVNFKVLDLGCGGGNVDGFLKEKFPKWDITGVDISDRALAAARKNFPKVKFIKSSVDALKFKPESFDLILSFDTLEHFENYREVIEKVRKFLKEDGTFFLAVPLERQFPTLYWFAYKLGLDRGKRGSVGHINVFNDEEIEKNLAGAGFVLEDKVFGGHLVYSILDFGCYFVLRKDKRIAPSFESGVLGMKDGPAKKVLVGLKDLGSIFIYAEDKVLSRVVGGRGYYFFKKSDFFSINKPLTVYENYQIKIGLSKFLRPKDCAVKRNLERLEIKNAKNILDFGCGDGIWLERILRFSGRMGVGVDISPALIKYAKARKAKKGNYFEAGGPWPIKKESMDFCYSFDVFEHLRDRETELKRISEGVKSGGKILIFTLNPKDKFTYAGLLKKFGSDYLYTHFDHDKSRYISPENLTKELEDVGFDKINFELYPGPFNLTADVFFYACLSFFEKILRLPPGLILKINDKFVRFAGRINSLLDKPFLEKGYSNGYFIWGVKK